MTKNLNAKTDEELMQEYQAGSEAAFDDLFARHSSQVFGFLSRRLGKKSEAEDLLQDVFFKLHRSKHLYDLTLPFLPWLFSITRSVLLDSLKKKKFEKLIDVQELDRIARRDNESLPSSLNLRDFISDLPPVQGQVVGMRIYDEKTFEEIAKNLSTSPGNARQLFSRGIKSLRQILVRKEK